MSVHVCGLMDGQPANTNINSPHPHSSARITLASPADAATAAAALSVDPELRPALVTRSVTADGDALVLRVAAADARTLRASACTLCDVAGVAARAVEAWPAAEMERGSE